MLHLIPSEPSHRGFQIKSAGRGAELRGAAPPVPRAGDPGAWGKHLVDHPTNRK